MCSNTFNLDPSCGARTLRSPLRLCALSASYKTPSPQTFLVAHTLSKFPHTEPFGRSSTVCVSGGQVKLSSSCTTPHLLQRQGQGDAGGGRWGGIAVWNKRWAIAQGRSAHRERVPRFIPGCMEKVRCGKVKVDHSQTKQWRWWRFSNVGSSAIVVPASRWLLSPRQTFAFSVLTCSGGTLSGLCRPGKVGGWFVQLSGKVWWGGEDN